MNFSKYWATEGCRHYAPDHEDRARHAWMAAQAEHAKDLKHIYDMIDNIYQGPISGSMGAALNDVMCEIGDRIGGMNAE